MPINGTWMLRSCATSVSSVANDATNTASTLRRTGSVSKNSWRSAALSIWSQIAMS